MSANLALRLPPDMRADLVAAANRNKRRSVSQEIVLRLRSTLIRDQEVERPRHIHALSEVVARIALGLEAWTKKQWNEDRYTQEKLSKGIDLLLYTYSCGEAVVPPAVRAAAARNPEDTFFAERLGELVAGGIISALKRPPTPEAETRRLMEQGSPPMYYPESWRQDWEIEQDLRGLTRPVRRKHR